MVIAVVPAGVAPVVDMGMGGLAREGTDVGLKVTVVPDGAPLALRLTVWATPLVTAVETVDVVLEPAVTVPEVGAAAMEKSLGGGDADAGLNMARPAVQYMALANDPVKVCAAGEPRTRLAATTE